MGRVEREVYAAATSPRHVRALTVGAGTLLAALPLPAPLRAGLGIAGYLGGLALPADHVPTDEPDHLWHLRRQVGAVGDWLDDRRGALGWDVETWLDRVLARARGVLDDPRLVTDPERLAGHRLAHGHRTGARPGGAAGCARHARRARRRNPGARHRRARAPARAPGRDRA